MKIAYNIEQVRGNTLIVNGEDRPRRRLCLCVVPPKPGAKPKISNPDIVLNHWIVTKVYDLAPNRWAIMVRPRQRNELSLVEYEDERVFRMLDEVIEHGYG